MIRSIGDQQVDEKFESGPGRFSDVAPLANLQFPNQMAMPANLQQQLDAANASANTARGIGFAGLVARCPRAGGRWRSPCAALYRVPASSVALTNAMVHRGTRGKRQRRWHVGSLLSMHPLIALAFALSVTVFAPVSAHANLPQAEPGVSATLPTAPPTLRLYFSEQPEPRYSDIAVYNAAHERFD